MKNIMNKKLVEYLKAYQEWRRGADTEQPDPTELGERLDEAIRMCQEAGFDVELLDTSKLKESREAHPLTTKEEAEKQVAEFDKVQPQTWSEEHKDTWATKAWRELRDVDAIVEERDALLSENERLNNIIIELNRIIDLNEKE
jgi:hypothetical protein